MKLKDKLKKPSKKECIYHCEPWNRLVHPDCSIHGEPKESHEWETGIIYFKKIEGGYKYDIMPSGQVILDFLLSRQRAEMREEVQRMKKNQWGDYDQAINDVFKLLAGKERI